MISMIHFSNQAQMTMMKRSPFEACKSWQPAKYENLLMNPYLPHYPANKPSDVEWLGDVPAHWEARRPSGHRPSRQR